MSFARVPGDELCVGVRIAGENPAPVRSLGQQDPGPTGERRVFRSCRDDAGKLADHCALLVAIERARTCSMPINVRARSLASCRVSANVPVAAYTSIIGIASYLLSSLFPHHPLADIAGAMNHPDFPRLARDQEAHDGQID